MSRWPNFIGLLWLLIARTTEGFNAAFASQMQGYISGQNDQCQSFIIMNINSFNNWQVTLLLLLLFYMGRGNPAPESSHGPLEKMSRMVIDFKISM